MPESSVQFFSDANVLRPIYFQKCTIRGSLYHLCNQIIVFQEEDILVKANKRSKAEKENDEQIESEPIVKKEVEDKKENKDNKKDTKKEKKEEKDAKDKKETKTKDIVKDKEIKEEKVSALTSRGWAHIKIPL